MELFVAIFAASLCAAGAEVKTFDVPSEAMGALVKVSVVTPRDYGADKQNRYPVVYLLHGAGNDHTTYLQPFLFDAVDRIGFIAVIPDGKVDWWMDSPVNPKVRRETFVVKELVPWTDGHFRTLPLRERRAIAGHSMGGQGAMRLAMRHTDVFGIVGNVMGGVDICACPGRKDLTRVLGPYKQNRERWREFSVLAEAEKLKPGALRLFTIVGTEDFFLQPNRDLHELLSKRHIPHEYAEVRGENDAMSRHSRPFAFWALGRLFERFAECFACELEGPLGVAKLVSAGDESLVCKGEEASISPDGRRLLFQRREDERYAVFVRDMATGYEERISPVEGQACQPEWCADGSVLYTYANETKTGFAAVNDATGWNLWVWKDGARRQITHGRQRAYTASPAPDGKTIYYACDKVKVPVEKKRGAESISRVGIAAVDWNGGEEKTVCVLPEINTACCEPRVSPDGKLLLRAELAKFRQPWRLVVSPVDDPASRTFLTTLREAAYAPAWSPDGKMIAYTGFRDGDEGWGVYVMPVSGMVMQRIAAGRNPSFAPDGRSVFYDRDGTIYRKEVSR